VANLKSVQHRSAQAMVATFLQMSRSAHLARWLHRARQRSLERRVEAATDMKQIVGLQRKLDAQQSQAAVVEQAAARFRNRAQELAQFAKAGLTMDDFERMGVRHVVDMDRFTAEVAKAQSESAEEAAAGPAPPPGQPGAAAATGGAEATAPHLRAAAGKPAAARKAKKRAASKKKPAAPEK
jgi:hypothetical protein